MFTLDQVHSVINILPATARPVVWEGARCNPALYPISVTMSDDGVSPENQ